LDVVAQLHNPILGLISQFVEGSLDLATQVFRPIPPLAAPQLGLLAEAPHARSGDISQVRCRRVDLAADPGVGRGTTEQSAATDHPPKQAVDIRVAPGPGRVSLPARPAKNEPGEPQPYDRD